MKQTQNIEELKRFAGEIRLQTLKTVGSLGFGHVGGSMSLADTMAVLYGSIMNIDPKDPQKKDRDWISLSKGHGGPVMYATLGLMGYYDVEETYTLNKPYTKFPSHTDRQKTLGVDLTTGSLGQGFSLAVGTAMGLAHQGMTSRVYAIIGDGESDEGQIWEAAQSAVHFKLDNLVCMVDNNKMQLDGAVDTVMSHGKGLAAKFDAFGWNVIELSDGNDVEAIYNALETAKTVKGQPTCVVLHTVKGKGAFFAEASGAHSSQPSKEDWDKAIAEAQAYVDKLALA